MPSKKKKLIRARMEKTGESRATAARQVANGARAYSGQPPLPTGTTECFDAEGNLMPDDPRHPEVELIDISGTFDPNDLRKAWVPGTAFDDPSMPRDASWPPNVKRVLSLAEYIEARKKQTGWWLVAVRPGPLVFMGQTLNVFLEWDASGERRTMKGART